METHKGDNVNLIVQQFGHSLGLFNQRDKESSCFRIFIALLKAAKADEKISSQELAFRTSLTRGTAVHHLNRLIEAGIVDVKQNRYFLRADNLKQLVSIVEKDTEEIIKEIKELAEKIDKELGI
jgi:predicted transcriptional regulator